MALAMFSGCANVKPTRSGYLSDYSQLKPEAKHKKQEARMAGAGSMTTIDSFYIEEVAWRSARPKSYVKKPQKEQALLKALREALRKELGAVHPVVDQPGPHTARVRAAITDEVNADVILNILVSIIALPVSNGGATIEAEVRGPAGDQLAAVDFAKAGGVFDVFGYFLPEEHAKQACRGAAKALRRAVQGEAGTKNVKHAM